MPEGSFSLVHVPADTSSSFYITFTEQIMVNHAIIGNNALVTGSVLYENDDLQYLMGVGKRYSFSNTEYNRLFEGNLYYTLGTPAKYESKSDFSSHVVVLVEPGIRRLEKIGKSKLGITDGEGPEYPSLQVLGKYTGAFAVALSVLWRQLRDWCCAMVTGRWLCVDAFDIRPNRGVC